MKLIFKIIGSISKDCLPMINFERGIWNSELNNNPLFQLGKNKTMKVMKSTCES